MIIRSAFIKRRKQLNNKGNKFADEDDVLWRKRSESKAKCVMMIATTTMMICNVVV